MMRGWRRARPLNSAVRRQVSEEEQLEYAPMWGGATTMYLASPLLVTVVVLIGGGAILMILDRTDPWNIIIGLVGVVLSAWLGASCIHWLRDAHAFSTRYRLSREGVTLERKGLKESVLWPQIDFAVECKSLRHFKLHSALLSRPIILMFGAGGYPRMDPGQKGASVRALLQEMLGERFRSGWLCA
jgi:hypothetical protein